MQKCVWDVIQPNTKDVLKAYIAAKEFNIDFQDDCYGNVKMCQWCGCAFLTGEPSNSDWCCKRGAMNRYRLRPLPDILRVSLEAELMTGNRDLSSCSRFINNYFAVAKLYTSGYDRRKGVDENYNGEGAAFKISGKAYVSVPGSLKRQYEAWIRDGTVIGNGIPDRLQILAQQIRK
eukprot:1703952-Rhodomonas_salina.1